MRKIIVLIVTFLMFIYVIPVEAATNKDKITVKNATIIINGETVKSEVYNINGYNYFRLRDFAELMKNHVGAFDVGYDSKTATTELKPNKPYIVNYTIKYSLTENPRNAKLLPRKVKVGANISTIKTYVIEDYTYFKLRDLGELLNYEIGYDEKTRHITVETPLPAGLKRLDRTEGSADNGKLVDHGFFTPLNTEFLTVNPDGTKTFVKVLEFIADRPNTEEKEYTEQAYNIKVVVKKLGKNNEILSEKTLPKELNLFGTFYSGEKYNYIAYGQTDIQQKNREVVRLVKYDKNFKRISHVSINSKDINTTWPFTGANGGQMVEVDDQLIYHTARIRYKAEDGLFHQSNLTLQFNSKSMQFDGLINTHVSHSMHQDVLYDSEKDEFIYLDHGDAFPRAITLVNTDSYGFPEHMEIFKIEGRQGSNVTGVSIGGLEQSKTHYLVAFNSIVQSSKYNYASFELIGADENLRNVYVYAVDKKSTAQNPILIKTEIANYEKSNLYITAPSLVKINDNRYLVMWQEHIKQEALDFWKGVKSHPIKYVYINGEGKVTSSVKTLNPAFTLSEAQPVVVGDQLIWTTSFNKQQYLNAIKLPN